MGLGIFDTGLSIFADTIGNALTVSNDGTKTTLSTITGDYFRIGDAGVTTENLDSEDDFMVTGQSEFKGTSFLKGALIVSATTSLKDNVRLYDDKAFSFGTGNDAAFIYETADADACILIGYMDESANSGNNVPAWAFGEAANILNVDLNLLDEVVQPHLVMVENAGKYLSATDATGDTGNRDELAKTGAFAAALAGDAVRITAGSGTTIAGWYWITDISGANDSVTLDRDFCGGSVTGVTFAAFHGLGMITPRAFYLPIYDGAPGDGDIDIPMAGACGLELSQANGRFYWRVGAAWKYVDATGGLSLLAEERIDPDQEEFQVGDQVKLIVDRINDDGSFHATPYVK